MSFFWLELFEQKSVNNDVLKIYCDLERNLYSPLSLLIALIETMLFISTALTYLYMWFPW